MTSNGRLPDPSITERSPLTSSKLTKPGENGQIEETLDNFNLRHHDDEEESFSFFRSSWQKKILLLSLGVVNFCAMACFSIMAPFYPAFADNKGVSETMVGIIFGSFEFVCFLTAPIFGKYMVHIGANFMFIAGTYVAGICTVLFGVLSYCPSAETFVALSLATRSIEAVGGSAYITASYTIIAQAYPKHVSTVIGIMETFTDVGMMVGPALGSFLYSAGGYGLPFYVLGGVLLLCAILCPKTLPNITVTNQPSTNRSVLYLLRCPLILLTCLVTICGTIGIGFMDPVLSNRLEALDLSVILIGVLFLIDSAMYALGAPLWGWITDTKGFTVSLLIVGNILTGLTYFLVGPATFLTFIPFEVLQMTVALVFMGFLTGAAIVPTYNAIFEGATIDLELPDSYETHGLISGLYNSCWSLGSFIGPMAAGYMVENMGFPWATSVCGFLFVSAGLMLLVYQMIKTSSHCGHRPRRPQYKRIYPNEADSRA